MPSFVLSKRLPSGYDSAEPGREAAWLVGRSLVLAEPRTVDILLSARVPNEPFLDDQAAVARATWHVRRDDVGAEPAVRPAFARVGHQERQAPEITAESVGHVLAEAVAQPPPAGRQITFAHLEANHLRVRLRSAEFMSAASLLVWRGGHAYDVPIVRDERGSRVDSAPDELDRPLRFTVDNDDGVVVVRVFVGWSMWDDAESAEYASMLDFAGAAIAGGYAVEQGNREFRERLPRGDGANAESGQLYPDLVRALRALAELATDSVQNGGVPVVADERFTMRHADTTTSMATLRIGAIPRPAPDTGPTDGRYLQVRVSSSSGRTESSKWLASGDLADVIGFLTSTDAPERVIATVKALSEAQRWLELP
jgi:hypothetical protein